MIDHRSYKFISFSAVEIYDLSYIHLQNKIMFDFIWIDKLHITDKDALIGD